MALLVAAALTAPALAACSSDGADVSCSLNDCTVTFDRGVDAKASVLGVDVKLVTVSDGQVTLDVEGSEVQVPVGGQASTEVAGLQVQVDSVTDDQVVVKVSRGNGGN